MSKYNYHQKMHYADLIGFLIDLQEKYGKSEVNIILKNHDQLVDDLLEFYYDIMEFYEKYI